MTHRASFSTPLLAAVLAPLLAGGCAGQALGEPYSVPAASAAKEPLPMNSDLPSMVQAALADAMRRAAPGSAAPTVVSAERVTWPDGSLGCPVPGRMYTMALVPGYRIRIQSGADRFDYHASLRGQPVLCPSGQATGPVPDKRVY